MRVCAFVADDDEGRRCLTDGRRARTILNPTEIIDPNLPAVFDGWPVIMAARTTTVGSQAPGRLQSAPSFSETERSAPVARGEIRVTYDPLTLVTDSQMK